MVEIEAKSIHSQLTFLKERSGMTLEEISRQSGVPKSTVQRILTADDPHCSLVYIISIAKVMGGSIWLSHPYDITGEFPEERTHENMTDSILADYGATVEKMSATTDSLLRHNRRLIQSVIVMACLLVIRMVLDIIFHGGM